MQLHSRGPTYVIGFVAKLIYRLRVLLKKSHVIYRHTQSPKWVSVIWKSVQLDGLHAGQHFEDTIDVDVMDSVSLYGITIVMQLVTVVSGFLPIL